MGRTDDAPKPKPLTLREAKFVKAKAQGLSNTKAAMIATGTTSVDSAKTLGHRLSTNVNVQEAVATEFEKQGITLERIIKPIGEALDAQKVVIIGKDEDAFADVQPDYGIQLKASGMAAQFLGFGKPAEGTTNVNFINFASQQRDEYKL